MKQTLQQKRLSILLVSLAGACALIAASFFLSAESQIGRIFFDRGATLLFYPFTIQNLMWIIFFVGFGELYYRCHFVAQTRQALDKHYLSNDPHVFYNLEDLIEIRKKTLEKGDLLTHLINALIIRYQVSQKSVDETHLMLKSQLELLQFKIDVDYNIVRYITWLIPTLGFIGTVMGIAVTLAAAGLPGAAEQPDFLSNLTSRLAVAFNTTLVALVMSAILVFAMHIVQGSEERNIQYCGEYCLNNLVNKLISK
jgi:biopolymer transport protein ExbB/TolQ